MGCASNRKKQTQEFVDQKWDYINLKDFKAKGCGAPFAYGYLWFSIILSCVVYAVDSFTAVQLLVFDRWSSQIQPGISFNVSKWIFGVCIILSFINLLYEGIRAWRVMKRENVAECFMDNLAVKWESIRMGQGQGWKRFLVFAALTKSKKGAEYIALFTYFGFKSWIRVILCSGPRQVVNAFTLKAVYEAKLFAEGKNAGESITAFFDKIKTLAEQDYRQAVILSGMAFTFVIWAFSAIVLLLSVCFYVFFLFHWIPRADGGLSGYCERKVNKALLRIVTKTVNKALAKQQLKETKLARKDGEKAGFGRVATLPILVDEDDSLPPVPTSRANRSQETLPTYESRPSTPSHIEMTAIPPRRPMLPRTTTMNSTNSAHQPLVGAAADMGYGRPSSPAASLYEPSFSQARTASPSPFGREPTLPRMNTMRSERALPEPTLPQFDALPSQKPLPEPTLPNMDLPSVQPPGRPGTSASQRSHGPPRLDYEAANNVSGPFEPPRFTASPAPLDPAEGAGRVAEGRSPSVRPHDNTSGFSRPQNDAREAQGSYSQRGRSDYARPGPAPGYQEAQYPGHRPWGAQDRQAEASSTNPYQPEGISSRQQTPMNRPPAGRRPQPPMRSGTDQPRPRGPPPHPFERNLTGPMAPANDFYQRPQTPQSARIPPSNYHTGSPGLQRPREHEYGYDVESQRGYH